MTFETVLPAAVTLSGLLLVGDSLRRRARSNDPRTRYQQLTNAINGLALALLGTAQFVERVSVAGATVTLSAALLLIGVVFYRFWAVRRIHPDPAAAGSSQGV